MRNNLIAVALVVAVTSTSFAGPLGLFNRRTYSNNTATTNSNVTYAQPRFPVANTFLGNAQGVANHLANLGRIGHFGGNPYAYEGVGMGSSPQAAIQNCCFYGRRTIADQGVAQATNGMWYACCRYH